MADSKTTTMTNPTTQERPDYWDGYHQAMLGHPLKLEGGTEYQRGRADGMAKFDHILMDKRCPDCNLNWWLFPPAHIHGLPMVRCIECKRYYDESAVNG